MLNRAAPNYKNSHPLVITLRLLLHPDRTLGEHIKKWRLEQGLFQRDLAKLIGVDEMTIVNLEKGKTRPTKKNSEKLKTILGAELEPIG
jgi:DNA-binding XRE family transcriptional regulator